MKRLFSILTIAGLGLAACGGRNPATSFPPLRGGEVADRPTSSPLARNLQGPMGLNRLRHFTQGQQTFTIKTTGSAFKFPTLYGFSGMGYYTRNNAPVGASLQITNSGTSNVLGLPVYGTGTVILYFEAQLVAGSSVTFKSASKTMQLTSPQFQAGASYWIAVYLWNNLIESYSAGVASSGTLTFQTPLSALTLNYDTPIGAELSIIATPTPSSTPSPTPTPMPRNAR